MTVALYCNFEEESRRLLLNLIPRLLRSKLAHGRFECLRHGAGMSYMYVKLYDTYMQYSRQSLRALSGAGHWGISDEA